MIFHPAILSLLESENLLQVLRNVGENSPSRCCRICMFLWLQASEIDVDSQQSRQQNLFEHSQNFRVS